MAFVGQGRKRRQMEAVRTVMAVRQQAVVRVSTLRQFGVTRVDLGDLHSLAARTAPSKPPPLVTVLRCGDERGVTAAVSGNQLTQDATALRVDLLGARDRAQPLAGVHSSRSGAARVLASHCCAAVHRVFIAQSHHHHAQKDVSRNILDGR
jgi:hypothetical protein